MPKQILVHMPKSADLTCCGTVGNAVTFNVSRVTCGACKRTEIYKEAVRRSDTRCNQIVSQAYDGLIGSLWAGLEFASIEQTYNTLTLEAKDGTKYTLTARRMN